MDLTTRRRALMAKIIALVKMVVTSATGIVSFVTDIVRPVKVTCEFSPVQADGTSSLDNPLPISGWTGVEITGAKNIITNSWEIGAIYGSNGSTNVGKTYAQMKDNSIRTRLRVADLIELDSSKAYTIKFDSSSYELVAQPYDSNGKTLLSTQYPNTGIWKTSSFQITGFANVAIAIRRKDGANVSADEYLSADIVLSETPTSLPISWQSTAGTAYGGSITLNEDGSADLVSEWRKITYVADGTNWGVVGYGGSGESRWFNIYITDTKHPCSANTPTSGDNNGLFNLGVWRYGATSGRCRAYAYTESDFRCVLVGIDRDVSTKEQMMAFLSTLPAEPEIVYRLKNPIRYHFDNIDKLKSFLGTNNIWHDMNGSITAEYWKKQ